MSAAGVRRVSRVPVVRVAEPDSRAYDLICAVSSSDPQIDWVVSCLAARLNQLGGAYVLKTGTPPGAVVVQLDERDVPRKRALHFVREALIEVKGITFVNRHVRVRCGAALRTRGEATGKLTYR